jgi:hypothetical protein
MPINELDIKQLMAMGFGEAQAQEGLTVSNGNLEVAVNYLLGGGIPPPPIAARPAEPPAKMESMEAIAKGLVTCGISQYNVDNGRSACTCIALTTASNFLQNQSVDSAFLTTMIHKGVENYQSMMSAGSSVEHLSAEEVLQKDRSNNPLLFEVETVGGIRQGVLSHDPYHPLGLMALLQGLRQESQTEWLAILITKTPETVLVCFPPAPVSPSSYWLVDSHPRPQLGVESAYAKLHPDLDSLALSLQAIFPCTELGPDIPEMMAMMYNSFDLYPLKRKT